MGRCSKVPFRSHLSFFAPGRANPLTAAIHPLRDSKMTETPSSLKNVFRSSDETRSGFTGGRGPLGGLGKGFSDISFNCSFV